MKTKLKLPAKDLVSGYELTRNDYDLLFAEAGRLKKLLRDGKTCAPLKQKTLGMIFDKHSTRTRISFEVGMYQLGGSALFLSSRDIQIGRGETIADTARIMSRYLDGIMIRTYSQKSVEEFARFATIPVINALTDLLHPCQVLSDLFTIIEKFGGYQGLKIAYIGDGNNMANSWIVAASRLPFRLDLACPEGYHPDRGILRRGMDEAPLGIALHGDPVEAVTDADVVYTDVWVSMGQEKEREERLKRFHAYQVNQALLNKAQDNAIVMHCLPAHRGEEIAAEVIDGPRSVVFDQAENRLHVQKALLEILMQ
jgi:ornithine carbamoyltransferase